MMFTLGRVLSAAGPTGSLTLKAQEVTSYTPCVILEALIFTENLGNALPSLVCETKIAWQLNQSCALPDQQSQMFQKKSHLWFKRWCQKSIASGNQIKVDRPLYAKDQSPLNVEPKAKLLGCSNILANLQNNRTNVIALRDLCILPILRRFL